MRLPLNGLNYGVGHILFSFLILAVVGLVSLGVHSDLDRSFADAYLAIIVWWFSRERRDYEVKKQNNEGFNPHTEWYKHWNPFKWSQGDLWGPIVFFGAALGLYHAVY